METQSRHGVVNSFHTHEINIKFMETSTCVAWLALLFRAYPNVRLIQSSAPHEFHYSHNQVLILLFCFGTCLDNSRTMKFTQYLKFLHAVEVIGCQTELKYFYSIDDDCFFFHGISKSLFFEFIIINIFV